MFHFLDDLPRKESDKPAAVPGYSIHALVWAPCCPHGCKAWKCLGKWWYSYVRTVEN